MSPRDRRRMWQRVVTLVRRVGRLITAAGTVVTSIVAFVLLLHLLGLA